jgi:uncharacterized protein with von Willebrand factor type A (vWA) domain
MPRYRYSRWDRTQSIDGFDAEELMEALSDDLMSDGDIWNALQRIARWGLQRGDEPGAPGLQNLLQRLRAQRQQELERYNLDSLMDDIHDRVQDVLTAERQGIERRLGEAEASQDQSLREMLQAIAGKKLEFLDSLPHEPGAAVADLADYEFLDDTARAQFDALKAMLEQQVLQSHFRNMQESLAALSGSELADLKEMMRDLNRTLREHLDGEEPDFGRFAQEHGRYFPGARSFDEIVAQLQEQSQQMESLMRSMSTDMRRSLDDMMKGLLRDEGLRNELATMAETLESVAQFRRTPPGYAFSGEQSITLEQALRLMRKLHDLDLLEREMRRAQDSGDLAPLNSARVADLMGDDAGQAVDRLKQLSQVLEEAGYVQSHDGQLELTARGIRIIGQKALQDIFQHLNRESFGGHQLSEPGFGGDRTDDTKTYEFGDPFLLDMSRTVMNSVSRGGRRPGLQLAVDDFEVFRTEQLTQASTVLMLDMSRSMPLRGCFVAAKKVALALNSLIRTQFPRDNLYIIGFSDFARQLRPESLHQITWGDYVYGTNMQHGFVMARRLLGRHQSGTRQIILITDGEPTAHFEGDRVEFAYPPTFRTFQETLREVARCTHEGIVINTFMLERSHYLTDFVNQMTRINRGRAFFATPERLGDYVLVDYVASKRNPRHP